MVNWAPFLRRFDSNLVQSNSHLDNFFAEAFIVEAGGLHTAQIHLGKDYDVKVPFVQLFVAVEISSRRYTTGLGMPRVQYSAMLIAGCFTCRVSIQPLVISGQQTFEGLNSSLVRQKWHNHS